MCAFCCVPSIQSEKTIVQNIQIRLCNITTCKPPKREVLLHCQMTQATDTALKTFLKKGLTSPNRWYIIRIQTKTTNPNNGGTK